MEPNRITVTEHAIAVPQLPDELDGVRIVHLTDFHLEGYGDAERAVVQIVRRADPEVLCLTGDYVRNNESLQFLPPFLMEMARGRRAYAVLGNHDHADDVDTHRLVEDIRRSGVVPLINEAATDTVRKVPIEIIGVDDPHTNRADLPRAMEELERHKKAGRTPRFVLLLAHSPDIILDDQVSRADLILCGHTHGGQVRLPFIGPLVTNSRVGRSRAAGLSQVGDAKLYVSRGLGTSMWRIRFNCPPEVAVLTLRKA